MVKEETWSVSLDRARKFFLAQEDVAECADGFAYGSCRIRVTELEPRDLGIWAAPRVKICLEGREEDVRAIYRRFLIQFLSTGG